MPNLSNPKKIAPCQQILANGTICGSPAKKGLCRKCQRRLCKGVEKNKTAITLKKKEERLLLLNPSKEEVRKEEKKEEKEEKEEKKEEKKEEIKKEDDVIFKEEEKMALKRKEPEKIITWSQAADPKLRLSLWHDLCRVIKRKSELSRSAAWGLAIKIEICIYCHDRSMKDQYFGTACKIYDEMKDFAGNLSKKSCREIVSKYCKDCRSMAPKEKREEEEDSADFEEEKKEENKEEEGKKEDILTKEEKKDEKKEDEIRHISVLEEEAKKIEEREREAMKAPKTPFRYPPPEEILANLKKMEEQLKNNP